MSLIKTPLKALQFSLNQYRSAVNFLLGLSSSSGSSGGGGAGTTWDYGIDKPDTDVRPTGEPDDFTKPEPDFPIPDLPPRNRIKPPPIKIYEPETEIPVPELPERIIPEPEQSPERRVTSDVYQSLADRKYGCLLANPLYNAQLDFCYYEDEDAGTFFGRMIDLITTILEELATNRVSGALNNACKVAVALFPLNFITTTLLFLSCEIITDVTKYYERRNLSLGSYPISGKINVGEINFQKCQVPEYEAETEDFTLELFPECAVPLSMYSETKGRKIDQLQIIFRNTDWDTQRKPRYFSLPNPKKNLTAQQIKNRIPSTWQSGTTHVDIFMDVANLPDGYKGVYKTTLFTNYENQQQVENFVYGQFQQWVNAFTDDVTIRRYQMKYHDGFDIFVGTFKLYRAVQVGWNEEETQWFTIKRWRLEN